MSYVQTVLADAPLHYWRLAEGEGELIHDIGSGGYHLESFAVPTHIGYSGIAADGGSLRNPNGPSIANAGALPGFSGAVTLEAWVWLMGYFNLPQTILDIGDVAIQMNGATANPQLYTNPTNLNAPNPITYQRWHHIVGQTDLSTMRLWVDALQVATIANTRSPTQSFIRIGSYSDHTRAIDAWITECAIYSGALSPTRISAHFLAQETSSPPVYGGPRVAFSNSTGGGTSIDQQLQLILNSVRKNFIG